MVEATLSGFSSFLDWRPLTFEKPLPRVWTCDMCGLMSKETVVLECVHVFCSDCYQRLLYKESPVCPLDATFVKSTEIKRCVLGESQKEQLVVQCLNAKHGCTFKGPLGDLEGHFTKDCDSHVVTCKRCGSAVLRTKLLEHLEKNCKEYVKVVAQDSVQMPILRQDSDSNGDHGWRFYGVLDDLVKCRVEEKVNLLPESMMQCTDLAQKLDETWQPCVKAAHDLKNISNLIEPIEHYAQDVTDIKQELTDLKVAVEQLNKPAHATPCKSDEKSAVCWRALGFYCSGIRAQNHIFVCINVEAKFWGAPSYKASPHVYATWCPNGTVSIRGNEVQVHQLVSGDAPCQVIVGFGLTFLGQSQNCESVVDMTLVLVHPTNAHLNKHRPLKSDELFRTQSQLPGFSFYYSMLVDDGFVADDMLLLCLKVSE